MTLRLAVQTRMAGEAMSRETADAGLRAELLELRDVGGRAEAAIRAGTFDGGQGRALVTANDRLREIFDGRHGGGVTQARRLGRELGVDAGDGRGFAARFRPARGWLRFLWRALRDRSGRDASGR